MNKDIYKELETDRLLLRKITEQDLNDIFEYASDNEATQYMPWDTHKSLADTKQFYNIVMDSYKELNSLEYVFVLKETGKVIGSGGSISLPLYPHCVEIGYIINKKYWGQGLVPEAMTVIINYLFNELNVHKIEAKHLGGNPNSGKVMQKLGMSYEGRRIDSNYVKGKYHDSVEYGIINPKHKFK